MNEELSKVFFRHYLFMFIVMLPFYLMATYSSVQARYPERARIEAFSWLYYTVYISRIVFVIDRVWSDPYLYENLKPCKKLRKKKKRSAKDLYKGTTLNAFLNSSSNIDYVQQILFGISVTVQARDLIKDEKLKKFESGQYSN